MEKDRDKILYLISEGYITKEIASQMGLTVDAVKYHRKELLKKYKSKTMPQVIKKYVFEMVAILDESVFRDIKQLVPKEYKTKVTCFIFLLLLSMPLFSQPDTLCLTGYLAGTYTAKREIKVDSAQSYGWPVTLQIGDCDTLDNYTPGIGVLKDHCIRDAEWTGITGYDQVLTDSASFFTPEAMEFFKFVGNAAIDDCGIDSFYVKELEIIPAGTGVDRPGETEKTFKVLFRAVDWTGKSNEVLMTWIRKPDSDGCI